MHMSERQTQQIDVLTVDESMEGETVTVVSTSDGPGSARKKKAEVDEDGVLRQPVSGVAFNAEEYDVR